MKLFKFKMWHTTVLIICLLVTTLTTGASAAESKPTLGGTSKYILELDGVVVGWLSSVEGGNATADVVLEPQGPDHKQKKHLAGVKYEDITITFSTGMSNEVYQWIKDSLEGKFSPKNGAIITTDAQFREASKIDFTNVLIKEVTFPALDAASKDAAIITVKITPEFTRRTVSNGKANLPTSISTKTKQWIASNFIINIEGVDTTAVREIPAITVKLNQDDTAIRDVRDYQKESGNILVPNLVIVLAESRSQLLYNWLDDFLIKGNNGDNKEKNGTLDYRTQDFKETFFTLNFNHLGIFKVSPDNAEEGSIINRLVKAEMYVESISFNYSK
jgi:phage tail-like protein